jgi:hypothetical protein
MVDENIPMENPPVEEESGEKIDRRTMAGRVGRFLAYTAPAVIALATAKDAGGTPG